MITVNVVNLILLSFRPPLKFVAQQHLWGADAPHELKEYFYKRLQTLTTQKKSFSHQNWVAPEEPLF